MAMTRAFLPVPILSLPPIIMLAFEKYVFFQNHFFLILTKLNSRNLLRRFPRLSIPLNTIACTISFGLALPISIALFPQKSKVNIKCF